MISRRQYFQLDDQPKLDGDRSFRGLKSYPDAGALEEGFLAVAENVRMEDGKVSVRKGLERKGYWTDGKAILGAGRYANSYDPTPADEIAIAIAAEAYLYDPGAGTTTTVPYQSGQTTGVAEFLQAFGSLFMFRGRGLTVPFAVNDPSAAVLGKYPLRYDGRPTSDGGLFKMPKGSTVLQVHGPRLPQKLAIKLWAQVDLAPIENRDDTFTFDPVTGVVTSGQTGHDFETGELVKFSGTSNIDGIYEVEKVDLNTILLLNVPSPAATEDQSASPRPSCWSESDTLTAADFGVMAGNRMALRADNNNVVFSSLMSTQFIGEDLSNNAEMLSFNEGTSDYIVGLFPFQDDDMIVFKRNSIHLAPNLTALATEPTELTRQMGCVERKTIAGAGGLVFFLSDSGVYAIDVGVKGGAKIGTSAAHLSITDKPISEDIQDQIDGIDWTNVGGARGVWYDNRYWLAVPTVGSDGWVSTILIYNSILQAWESIDSVPAWVKEFLLLSYQGRQRLFIVDREGTRFLVESREGRDQFGSMGWSEFTDVLAKATTRAYDFDDMNQKRWLRGAAAFNTLAASGGSLVMTAHTQSPEKILPAVTLSASAAEEKLKRFPLRGRGKSIQLNFTHQSSERWELREVRVEGSTAGRALKHY